MQAPPTDNASSAATERTKLLLTIAAVGAVMIVAVAPALRYGPPTPVRTVSHQPSKLPLVGSVVLLLVGLGTAVALVRHWLHRMTLRRSLAAAAAKLKLRLARLRSNPATAPYADLIARGQSWSDEQIAYDLDPTMLATCVHLQAIERVMRQRGLPLRRRWTNHLEATCRIARPALESQYPPVPPAVYAEYYYTERFGDQEPVAMLYCPACQSRIVTLHPDGGLAGAPWFPEPPQPSQTTPRPT